MAYEYLGTDLRFDRATGDFQPLPAGDLSLISRADCVLQDVFLRLVTPKGDLWCHPDYGVDIYDYLHAGGTLTNRLALCEMVREEVMKDPRIVPDSIEVQVSRWDMGTGHLAVSVTFEIEGFTNKYNLVVGWDMSLFDDEIALTGGEDAWLR